MKDKKTHESLEQFKDAVTQSEDAVAQANQVLQELDNDALDQVTGAGNPFEKIPRPDLQPLDNGVRDNA